MRQFSYAVLATYGYRHKRSILIEISERMIEDKTNRTTSNCRRIEKNACNNNRLRIGCLLLGWAVDVQLSRVFNTSGGVEVGVEDY